jgi:hypothetical protein
MIICPLCLSKGHILENISGPDKRDYRRCTNCKLIYTSIKYQQSKTQQKKHADAHANGIENSAYVKFLETAIEPALPLLTKEHIGLDFGNGKDTTLSEILAGKEINCQPFSPLQATELTASEYDFVFSTEYFEHSFLPAKELKKIKGILKLGGYLIVLTALYKDTAQFKNWYYPKDPTRVSFFHKSSFDFICRKFGFELVSSDDTSVVILQKVTQEVSDVI